MKLVFFFLFLSSLSLQAQRIPIKEWDRYLSQFKTIVVGEILSKTMTYNKQKRLAFYTNYIKVDSIIKGSKLLIGKTIKQIIPYNEDCSDCSPLPMFFNESEHGIFFLTRMYSFELSEYSINVIDNNSIFIEADLIDTNIVKPKLISGKVMATNNFVVKQKRKKKYVQQLYLQPDSLSHLLIPNASAVIQIIRATKKLEKNYHTSLIHQVVRTYKLAPIETNQKYLETNDATIKDLHFVGAETGLEMNNQYCNKCYLGFGKKLYSKQELFNHVKQLIDSWEQKNN